MKNAQREQRKVIFARRGSCLKLADYAFLLARLESLWCIKLMRGGVFLVIREKRTLEALNEHFYWPAMIQDVHRIVE